MSLLPRELLHIIFCKLDTISRMQIKAVCKEFAQLVTIRTCDFTLKDNEQRYCFTTINGFVNHIYEAVIETDLSHQTYHLLRKPDINIVFSKIRIRNKNHYSVNIEVNNIIHMRLFYESSSRHYKYYKFMNNLVCFPALFYVVALRFMIKIYKMRPIDYNFDVAQIPYLNQKMITGPKCDITILPELLSENLTIV